MNHALDAALAGLFDFAGMYPPASLGLEEALQASASFPKTLKRPGLVGADLVLGVDKLRELDARALAGNGFAGGRPFRACLLGAPLQSPAHDFSEDRGRIQAFNGAGEERRIVSYEFKLESGGRVHREDLKGLLAGARSLPGDILVFAEPDLSGPSFSDILRELGAALADLNEQGEGPRIGLKVRGAGPTAVDAPRLAHAIIEVCRRGLPFKATAGLHHPIPEKERYGNELGFLNCLMALILARDLGLGVFSEERALECLRADKPGDFRFDEGLAWGKFSISLERALEAREQAHFSIGSCSLAEPDQDLVRLFGQD